MNRDFDVLYTKAVELSCLFADSVKETANITVSNLAINNSFPIISRFLLEEGDGVVKEQWMKSFMENVLSPKMLRDCWVEYNDNNLRHLLNENVPTLSQKMDTGALKELAARWRLGQNVSHTLENRRPTANLFGLSENEFVQLNEFLVNKSVMGYYDKFFQERAKNWCETAQKYNQKKREEFEKIAAEVFNTAPRAKM